MLNKFLSDKRGNLAITSAIALVPIFAAVAAAVDYSQISRHSANIQQALDAAALATAKKLGNSNTNLELEDYSRKFFLSNIGRIDRERVTFAYDDTNLPNGSTIKLNAHYSYQMLFGGILNRQNYTMDLTSIVKSGNDMLEIALVLDNSGSMSTRNGGISRISTARTAAKDLVNQLHAAMANSNHAEPIKFSLVPFGSMVNVGSNYDNASWMDTTGAAPIHHEDLNWADNPDAIDNGDGRWTDAAGNWLTRFTLFDDMSNTNWKGCVELRPYPYSTTDAPANINTPDTLFVPAFAPDEPDDYTDEREQISQVVNIPGSTTGALYCKELEKSWNQCKKWNDNYEGNIHSSGVAPNLDAANYNHKRKRKKDGNGVPRGGYEFAGVVTPGTTQTQIVDGDRITEEYYDNSYLDDNSNMPAGMLPRDPDWTGTGAEQNKRQEWTWKYLNQSPNTNSVWKGPNARCTTNALTPLTTSKQTVISAIDNMDAEGATNIPMGIAWGWRSLSHGAPFTQGRPSSTPDNSKILIVMTDGNNTYYTPNWESQYNKSKHGAYGYSKNGRIFEGYSVNNPDHTRANFQAAMDEHMLETCTNAKNDGVRIYTVAFDVPANSTVKTMLETCASTNPKTALKQYYDASGREQLLAAFTAISSDISNLRIAQ